MPASEYHWLGDVPLQWRTFLDTPPNENHPDDAGVFVIPVPYDSTTSFKAGARHGPAAIIEASKHIEDYDIELDCDISATGIHTTPELLPQMDSPQSMIAAVRTAVATAASHGKLTALLGGEHTITMGAVQAYKTLNPDLSVLYLDAHADMRDCYQGTRWGHASVARRIMEFCPVALVGVRSTSEEEMHLIRTHRIPTAFWTAGSPDNVPDAMAIMSESLTDKVYISIDLDVLDPSLMSAVGTPEPGGMLWHDALELLRIVSRRAEIVGFDIVELSPREGPIACAFTAAKLAYKLIGYATATRRR
ncbi:MAG: agmatinase [Chloroflexi bacterium]|nr:agmatinase [Chloroflexota bacterium]